MYQKLIIIGNLGSNPETWGASYEVTADTVRFLDGKKDDVDDSYSAEAPF
jgi:hypothetical protein